MKGGKRSEWFRSVHPCGPQLCMPVPVSTLSCQETSMWKQQKTQELGLSNAYALQRTLKSGQKGHDRDMPVQSLKTSPMFPSPFKSLSKTLPNSSPRYVFLSLMNLWRKKWEDLWKVNVYATLTSYLSNKNYSKWFLYRLSEVSQRSAYHIDNSICRWLYVLFANIPLNFVQEHNQICCVGRALPNSRELFTSTTASTMPPGKSRWPDHTCLFPIRHMRWMLRSPPGPSHNLVEMWWLSVYIKIPLPMHILVIRFIAVLIGTCRQIFGCSYFHWKVCLPATDSSLLSNLLPDI